MQREQLGIWTVLARKQLQIQIAYRLVTFGLCSCARHASYWSFLRRFDIMVRCALFETILLLSERVTSVESIPKSAQHVGNGVSKIGTYLRLEL